MRLRLRLNPFVIVETLFMPLINKGIGGERMTMV